jgi:hypothetical protein
MYSVHFWSLKKTTNQLWSFFNGMIKFSIAINYPWICTCSMREGVAKVAPSIFGDLLQGVAG